MAAAESQVPVTPEEFELEGLIPDAPELKEGDRAALDARIDYCLQKIGELEDQIEENTQAAQLRRFMVDQWERQQNDGLERRIRHLQEHIRALAEGYDFGKKKSRKLPFGEFGVRISRREGLEVINPDEALAFAERNRLPIKREVQKSALLAYFRETRSVPLGCRYVEPEESFYVKAERGVR